MSSETARKTLVVTCDEAIDIAVVEELHQNLRRALEEGQAIEIEAGQVERADTAVLQTLYACFKEARSRDVAVKWRRVSEAVVDAAELLGLTQGLALNK